MGLTQGKTRGEIAENQEKQAKISKKP